jgi:transcriptional regulator NrdR family protein
MTCPKCYGMTAVKDSREREGKVYRRRECINCGNRFSTHEIPIDTLNATYKKINALICEINSLRKGSKNDGCKLL